MCWNVVSDEPTMKRCLSLKSTLPDPYRNEIIYGLLSATKYNVVITRCGDDGTNLDYSESKFGITRSAAINATGKRSATSFDVNLGLPHDDDVHVQVVVAMLSSFKKPKNHHDAVLEAYKRNNFSNESYVYVAAMFSASRVYEVRTFTVGDGKKYNISTRGVQNIVSYQNVILQPDTFYSVFQRMFKNDNLYYDSEWMDVIKTGKLMATNLSLTPSTLNMMVSYSYKYKGYFDASYEELDLTRVRNVYLTRNDEELDGNYENLDESKRDEKDDYQSLNTSDDDSTYDDVVPNVIPTHHYQNT
ncbi:uncharacterized protein LOC124452153 [Xenia sp. Carnegie-2017]|uniref:uncharacterized protein LOC124452153 n=1 Tax=Xenia sp. Carnegie-2017 TaxID=2897299 RepID=UPI001F047C77|nr:uncharacterized protein LOC124452153 [Xenia sp. Carnegie-2017]